MGTDIKRKLATLCVGAVMVIGVAGCETEGPPATPVVANPTSTAEPTAVQGEPTAEPTTVVEVPTNTVVVVPNPTASPTVVAGAPPAQRTVTAFARYVLQPSSVNPSVPMYSVTGLIWLMSKTPRTTNFRRG